MAAPSWFPDLDDPLVVKMAEYARVRLRDYPELNRLTEGHDHGPRFLQWAVIDTLSDWSSTPPFIGMTLSGIVESGMFSLFTKGVVIVAMESLAILHMRNHLAYSDGGINVQTENPQMIQAWLQMSKSEYEQKKQRVLISKNIESLLDTSVGGVHSEYIYINSFYGHS